jgi:hypothetical protein
MSLDIERKVVSDNIVLLALPHLSKKEQMIIEKNLINTYAICFLKIKTLSISKEEMEKRFVCKI